jgi:branched-subunit amino acid aminotransferase/4-amino-4-deoxychorismate lyase
MTTHKDHDQQINAWREEYLTSLKDWKETINPLQLHYASEIKKHWHRTKYVARNLPFEPEKMVICPPHSALNVAPNQQHRGDYATGLFEGSSAEPAIDPNGKIVAVNVVLHAPRMARFARSLHARGYKLPMPIEKFAQSVLDIAAIHGADIVTSDDGLPTRAYIRPSAGPGVGPWGLAFKPDYFIETSNLIFRWGAYFADRQRIFCESGAKAVITGTRRMFPITGKHASNYGSACVDGNIARNMKYDELIFLAPYCIKNGAVDYGIVDFDEVMKYGVIADGPGEEIFGVLKDGTTLVYPPMRVNRLGGTVLNYLMLHLAKTLGLEAREQDITLQQIRDGEIVGLGFAGNAVKVTPIGQVDIVKPVDSGHAEKTETLVQFGIHPLVKKICEQYDAELSGRVKPSHPSLLTPVDLEWGQEFRSYLDDYWTNLGFEV